VELIKIQKDLASNVAELETIVAELETIKEKITDTKKTVNTENQDDLLTLAQLEKTKDELEKLVKELTEKFIARKKELEDNNQAESRVAQSEATAAQKPTKLSKENKEDVYSLLADLNSYVDKTKCYNPYDPPDEIEAVQDEVKFVNASNMSGRQMGEQNISLAMCNGNFDGMYDGGGWGQVANEAAGAAGMWMGSMQER